MSYDFSANVALLCLIWELFLIYLALSSQRSWNYDFFLHPGMHWFIKHLLAPVFASGTLLDARDTEVNGMHVFLPSQKLTCSWKRQPLKEGSPLYAKVRAKGSTGAMSAVGDLRCPPWRSAVHTKVWRKLGNWGENEFGLRGRHQVHEMWDHSTSRFQSWSM